MTSQIFMDIFGLSSCEGSAWRRMFVLVTIATVTSVTMVMIDDLHTSHVTESNSTPPSHHLPIPTRVDNQGDGGLHSGGPEISQGERQSQKGTNLFKGGSRISRRRGRQPSRRCVNLRFCQNSKNSMKLRKFWVVGGRA